MSSPYSFCNYTETKDTYTYVFRKSSYGRTFWDVNGQMYYDRNLKVPEETEPNTIKILLTHLLVIASKLCDKESEEFSLIIRAANALFAKNSHLKYEYGRQFCNSFTIGDKDYDNFLDELRIIER